MYASAGSMHEAAHVHDAAVFDDDATQDNTDNAIMNKVICIYTGISISMCN